MKRFTILLYSLTSYVVFLATFLYSIGFIGNLIVPKSIDSVPTAPLATALFINLSLLGLFAVQHSVMARPFFKRWIERFIPAVAERSTYVLASSVAMILMFVFWEPVGGMVWSLESRWAVTLAYAGFAVGWGLILFSTFAINHFDLFGLRQAWKHFRGLDYTPLKFVQPWIYRVVRHPLYVGWFMVFWCTPTMTVTHLLFAVATTAYTLIAIQWEERDLADMHPEYEEYKRRVPALIPSLVRPIKQRIAEARS